MAVLAIDVGGTKLAVGVIDDSGAVLKRDQRPTVADGSGNQLFADLVELVRGLDPALLASCTAVGVGCGGPMTIGGAEVSPLNIPAWRSFPLRSQLADEFGLPVSIDGDAKALARAEGWIGAAVGVSDFVAMVVSTGVGGGIVLDGRMLDGAGGNAGHIGHIVVEPEGRRCQCGARGCLEAEASGTAIAAITGRPAAEATVAVRERTGMLVGRAVASTANLLDLRLAVVSGSVALGFGEVFFDAAQAEIDRTATLDYSVGTRIVPGGLGDEGPLIGAAAVALRP
jgi:glucokinase